MALSPLDRRLLAAWTAAYDNPARAARSHLHLLTHADGAVLDVFGDLRDLRDRDHDFVVMVGDSHDRLLAAIDHLSHIRRLLAAHGT